VKDESDGPVFGRELWDWISEERSGPNLKMLCWGCGESVVLTKQGNRFPGFLQFFKDHRGCMEMKGDKK